MTRRRSKVIGVSASAVDLLSCGLAAAVVLWVLVLTNNGLLSSGYKDRVNGVVRLSQYGIKHLFQGEDQISIRFPSGGVTKLSINQNGAIQKKEAGTYSQAQQRIIVNSVGLPGEPASVIVNTSTPEGFAGETSILFKNVPPGTEVIYNLRVCYEDKAPHPITVLYSDRHGPQTRIMFWQRGEDLTKALKQNKTHNGINNFVKWLAANKEYLNDSPRKAWFYGWKNDFTINNRKLKITATNSGKIKVDTKEQSKDYFSHVDQIKALSLLVNWCNTLIVQLIGTGAQCR